MGFCFEYRCTNPACGHASTVSGGRDFGFCGEVETMVCLDCRELMDVLIGRPAGTPSGLEPVEKKCEKCGGQNLKKFHSGKTRCPKCGFRLKKSEDFNLWD